MLCMSKAFDTVSRSKLMSILESILSDCELHMMHVLINDVILNVRLGDKTGSNINTSVGICQGDCQPCSSSSIWPLPLNLFHLISNKWIVKDHYGLLWTG